MKTFRFFGDFAMSRNITYGDLKLHRAVMEIRYPDGYKYWDCCGKCILSIKEKTNDVFEFVKLRGGDECVLKLKDAPSNQMAFGFKHLTLSAMRLKNLDFFKKHGPILLDVAMDEIGITQITRVGMRFLYVYKTETIDEANNIINSMKLFKINAEKFEGFGQEIKTERPTLLIIDNDVKMNLNISAASTNNAILDELGAKDDYSPPNCILVDIDFFMEDLVAKDLSLETFIYSSFKKVKDNSERDKQMLKACNEGYSQHAIAECLQISQPHVNRIIKKMRGIGIT